LLRWDAQFAEVLTIGAVLAHIMFGQQGEARIRSARAIRVDRVLGKLAEACRVAAEAIGAIGIAGNAGHDLGIGALHGARGAADRDDAGRAAHPHIVEPAQCQSQMLGEADGCVGGKREACNRKPIDARFRDFRGSDQSGHGAAEKPMRAPD